MDKDNRNDKVKPSSRTKSSSRTNQLSIEDTGRSKLRLAKAKNASGIDPYDGALANKAPSRKKDLRKLGEWLEAKRKAEELKRQEDETRKAHKG